MITRTDPITQHPSWVLTNAVNAQWRCAHVRENTHDVVREPLRNLNPLVTTERLDPFDAGELTPKWRATVQSLNVGWFESSQAGIASGTAES